jgi:deoxyribose-phosphate aldolase
MLPAYLDSTNLQAACTREDIQYLCEEAIQYKMAAVCINPCRLQQARELLAGSGVKLCTVIGFPLGADRTEIKVNAARLALDDGAQELDLVMNIGRFKDKEYTSVARDIEAVLRLKHEYSFILKVIVESALLESQELVRATQIVGKSGADYIKTSTGFSSRGASLKDIEIIKACKPDNLKIKASGGIKELDFALQLIKAGADRLGSSSAGRLVEEYLLRGGR